MFWLAPPDSTKTLEEAWLDFTRPAAEAIRRHAVPRVVSITALGRGTPWQNRAGPVTASIRMDDMLMESGAAFRGLAMPVLHGEHAPAGRGDQGEGHVFRSNQARS